MASLLEDDLPPSFEDEASTLGLRQRKSAPQASPPADTDSSYIIPTFKGVYAPASNRKATIKSDTDLPTRFPMRPSFQSLPSIDAPNADSTYAETLMGGKGLLTSLRPSEESQIHGIAISTIDRHFKYFTVWLFCTWASLVAIMYIFVPKENIVSLSGLEQRAAFMSMSLIFVSFLSRIIPLLGMGRRGHGAALNSINIGGASDGDGGFIRGIQRAWDNVMRNTSGILMGGLAIQVVAFSTDFLMAFFPVPVVLDPVLGTRVHVLRWCEWFPCATFMTFMMEGADLFWPVKEQTETGKLQKVEEQGPPPDFLQKKYMHAAAQGGAVFLGLLFPFCPGFYTWTCAMVVSCSLYSLNYPRMRQRRNEIPDTLREGATVEETERYNSAITALRLRYVCTFVWSIIVALYFVSSVGPKFAPEDSILRNPAANMCCECFFDVLSKVLFLVTIMDVHHAIFDPFARSERRLEELRKLMSAVWESSSDPIAISVRTGFNGGISTLLSPAFFALGGGRGALRRLSKDEIKDLFWNKSVLFQMPGDVLSRENGENGEIYKIKPEDILSVDFTEFSTGLGQSQGVVFGGQVVTPEMGALTAVAESVIKAWKNPRSEPVFTHELSWTRENKKKVLVYSEAKISRLDENSLIVVIRDISERVKVFETEKKILYETTSRQKDAEANRFTRHEVKNGLLAAIGLYESLCEAQGSHLFQDIAANADFGLGESDSDANVVRCMNELGKSLHETLDTIMIEAMTRDLIHDVYRPHREKCDVATVIGGFSDTVVAYDFSSAGNMSRFPLICKPSPLPCFNFDPNLLRYLHRQILSNACKYGKTGGVVLTEIIYCEQPSSLKIKVINLPGEFHEQLVAMGSEAEDAVFRKGAQIHEHMIVGADSTVGSTSKKTELAALPGDGGWIIKKCARVMRGQCSIKFEESRTVFTMDIPARLWGASTKIKTPIDIKKFKLPQDTWGICIDDSKIQQKLLRKFCEFAGLPNDRIHVFGQSSDEITSFVDFVVDFMGEHMGDQILLIADENLDIVDEAAKHKTISGSQLVENIRLRLLPEQERCLLSLVRSANDSASDIAIYNARAHGFLPKAPIKKGNVLETLAPLWFARYPPVGAAMDDDSVGSSSRKRSDSFSSLESALTLEEQVASTPVEILSTVNEMDKLFANESVGGNWELIREKLHALKGDLLTMQVGSKVIATVGTINSFRANHSREKLVESWNVLREQIVSLATP